MGRKSILLSDFVWDGASFSAETECGPIEGCGTYSSGGLYSEGVIDGTITRGHEALVREHVKIEFIGETGRLVFLD